MKFFIISMLLILNSLTFAGGHKTRWNAAFDNGSNVSNTIPHRITYGDAVALDTSNRIPGLHSWWDYWTNGQNQRMVCVLGDTVIAANAYIDSANASVSGGRTMYFQISYDGGVTWLADAILLSPLPDGGAYPDLVPVILDLNRTIVVTGRQFGPAHGFAGVDVLLGAGSFTNTAVPSSGLDYFSCWLSSTQIGGVHQVTDNTLYFRKFNYVTNTFAAEQTLAVPPTDIDASARKCVASSTDGQNVFAMWWVSTTGAQKMLGKSSTDGGTTFGAIQTVMPTDYTIDGIVMNARFGMDVVYKPNSTTVVAAFNTLPVASVKGYKIVSWSPGVNGGNPVVVADYTNTPALADTLWAFNSSASIQVGMTYVSHPSLAYSSDGSTLYCAFSVCQKDSVVYPDNTAWLFNDIYSAYSTNDGATWSTPVKLSFNTPDADEIYPVLSKTGNAPGNFGLMYMLSGYPGSSSFTDLATPRSINYACYVRVDPVTGNQMPIGINTISTEVPAKFSLEQNYPNPFNPSTTIRFNLSKGSLVNIRIFDVAGREVEHIVKGEMVRAGTHEVKFNAGKLASGVYFYTLETDNFRETKKMMLVK
jgi:hypothetical protein